MDEVDLNNVLVLYLLSALLLEAWSCFSMFCSEGELSFLKGTLVSS